MLLRRKRRASHIIAAALIAICMAYPGPARSQQQSSPFGATSLPPGIQTLVGRIQPEMPFTRYLDSVRAEFALLDANADGKLDQVDIDLHEAMEALQHRSSAASVLMRYDLDGDGVVTEPEVRAVMQYQLRSQLLMSGASESGRAQQLLNIYRSIDGTLQSLAELDTNKDGKLTYAEASKTPRPQQRRGVFDQTLIGRVQQAMTLAPGSKEGLTFNEYLAAAEALYRKIDTNKDDRISQQELIDYWRGPSAPDAAAQTQALKEILARVPASSQAAASDNDPSRAGCAMPAPSANAKIVLLGAYKTEALSSVAIGSQDAVVHAGRIVIERGDEPLYVVLATYSAMIWQFSGAVERIERVVMSSQITGPNEGDGGSVPLVGATGVPANKIAFLAKAGCINYFSEAPSAESVRAAAAVRQSAGREPAAVVSAYAVSGFSVPSGTVDAIGNNRDRRVVIQKNAGTLRIEGDPTNFVIQAGPSNARDDLYMYSPGGLVQIDPKAVVSSRPAATYEVFPQQAGLVQLLETGVLKQNRSGDYVVQKKTRFPAGLAGAHSVKFLVLRGTPVPEGDPGHSCVTVEDPAVTSKFEACR